jgi:hypothetical protein
MKFKSQVLAQASGSIGGVTYSRNRGGMYQRIRANPVNPNTSRQVAARAAMSALVFAWVNTLTPTQRAGWDTYAFNVPLIDKLGEPINVGGLGMYVRTNVPRIVAGLARIDTAPTTFTQGDVPVTGAVTVANDGSLSVAFTGVLNSNVILQEGRPVNPSINFYDGPWSFAAQSATTPVTGTSRYTLTTGQALFLRLRRVHDDGRLSPAVVVKAIVEAAG